MRLFVLPVLVALSLPAAAQTPSHSFEVVRHSCATPVMERATGAAQTVEVLLPDNTSVILGPGSAARVSCGVPGKGIAVAVTRGLVRVSGGVLNARHPVAITTPQAQLSLRNGAAIIAVAGPQTRTHLLTGTGLVVAADGIERRLYRPGFQVTVSDGASPGVPQRLSAAQAVADLVGLSRGLDDGTRPRVLGAIGSGRPAATIPARPAAVPASLPATPVAVTPPTDTPAVQPPPETPTPPVQPPVALPAFDGSFSVAAAYGTSTADTTATALTPVSSNRGNVLSRSGTPVFAGYVGPTTNRLIGSPLAEVSGSAGAQLAFPSVFSGLGGLQPFTEGHGGAGLLPAYLNWNSCGSCVQGVFTFISGGRIAASAVDPTITGTAATRNSSLYGDGDAISSETALFSQTITGPVLPATIEVPIVLRAGADSVAARVTMAVRRTDQGQPGASEALRQTLLAEGSAIDGFNAERYSPLFGVRIGGVSSSLQFGCSLDGGGECSSLDGAEVVSVGGEAVPAGTVFGFIPVSSEAEARFHGLVLEDVIAQLAAGLGLDPVAAAFNPAGSSGFSSVVALFALPDSQLEGLQHFLNASGNLNGLPQIVTASDVVVDRYFLSTGVPGPSGPAEMEGRAFARSETWLGLDGCSGTACTDVIADFTGLLDTGLLVVNPAGDLHINTTAADTDRLEANSPRLIHLDFGLADVDGRQVSTAALTLGQVGFRRIDDRAPVQLDPSVDPSTIRGDAIVQAFTLGTARAAGAGALAAAPTLITSELRSSAAGGGNAALPGAGRLGYFVLDNAGIFFDDVALRNPDGTVRGSAEFTPGAVQVIDCVDAGSCRDYLTLAGGDETGLGDAGGADNDQRFALTRLAVGTGSGSATPAGETRFGLSGVTGWASGFLERADAGAIRVSLARDPAVAGPNLAFTGFDDATNGFTGTLELGGRVFAFGAGQDDGAEGMSYSTYVNDRHFAAIGHGADYAIALFSGAEIARQNGLAPERSAKLWRGSEATATATQTRMANYQHVRWGFFMGDTGAGQAHLGSFAGGAATEAGVLASLRNHVDGASSPVTATYSGHLIGNVVNAGDTYVAAGTWRDNFSYGRNAWEGTGAVTFDQGNYGLASTGDSSGSYRGELREAAGGSDRVGTFTGGFIGAADLGGVTGPAGVAGSFSIGDMTGGYRAEGTFGAELGG